MWGAGGGGGGGMTQPVSSTFNKSWWIKSQIVHTFNTVTVMWHVRWGQGGGQGQGGMTQPSLAHL